MAPIKSVQIRSKYAPWLSPALKEAMKERDQAQLTAQETGFREDWSRFRKLRNTLNNKLKGAKKSSVILYVHLMPHPSFGWLLL